MFKGPVCCSETKEPYLKNWSLSTPEQVTVIARKQKLCQRREVQANVQVVKLLSGQVYKNLVLSTELIM